MSQGEISCKNFASDLQDLQEKEHFPCKNLALELASLAHDFSWGAYMCTNFVWKRSPYFTNYSCNTCLAPYTIYAHIPRGWHSNIPCTLIFVLGQGGQARKISFDL